MTGRPVTEPNRERFLDRWSRRKRAEEEEAQEETASGAGPGQADDAPVAGRMRTAMMADDPETASPGSADAEKPLLTDDDMPPIESLDEHSDFSGFLSPAVSEKLRRAAMRKLFSAAVFNVRDGLDDYDEDFTSFEPLGDMVTSDMKHRAEVAERRRLEAERAAAEEQAALDSTEDGSPDDGSSPEQGELAEQAIPEGDSRQAMTDGGEAAAGNDEDAGSVPAAPKGERPNEPERST